MGRIIPAWPLQMLRNVSHLGGMCRLVHNPVSHPFYTITLPYPYSPGSGPGQSVYPFPKPRVPLHPVLSFRSPSRPRLAGEHPPAVIDAGRVEYTTSGRASIARALLRMALGNARSVLMPAYHCTAMVEPVVWAGGEPVFYRIREDLSVDLDDVAGKLDETTRVLLITHYFGFPQDGARIRAFCNAHGLALIEDCAHAFFGGTLERPIGSHGHFAVASPWKFFPCFDGGCLVSHDTAAREHALHGAGKGFEFKAAINAVEGAMNYSRLKGASWLLHPLIGAKDVLWNRLKRNESLAVPANAAMNGGLAFEPFWVDKRMSHFSRTVLRCTDFASVQNARRANYRRLRDELSGLPLAQPLKPGLPDDVVPYVFPLHVERPEEVFAELKLLGIPILRFGETLWPGMDSSVCAVSNRYSRDVFQFPCHQELTDEEMDWMIGGIRTVLARRRRH